MTPFEGLAAAYFVLLLAAAPRAARPRRGILCACGAIVLVIVARFMFSWSARVWLGHAYLLLGYWIPAAFVPSAPNHRFERWLARFDGSVPSRLARRRSQVLEAAYLACYPLVPAAFLVVFAYGAAEDVGWFWLDVLGAGYVCYITLPWTAARPPRLVDPSAGHAAPRAVASLNAAVLGRMSHQLVTFPSGHVAVSLAAALGVWRVWPEAGALFGVMALLIAVAAVAGRYHYALDVVLGLLVGAVVPALTGFFA